MLVDKDLLVLIPYYNNFMTKKQYLPNESEPISASRSDGLKTSVTLSRDVVLRIKKWNHTHPEEYIHISATCRSALRQMLEYKQNKHDKPNKNQESQ
jgi:hypothetical protein